MHNYVPVDFDPFTDHKEIEKIVSTNESQKEIWLACIFGGDEANLAYNESISLEFEGQFYVEEFKLAVRNLVLRHEALRSTISPNGETLITYRDFPAPLVIVDLSGQDPAEQKASIQSFLEQELGIPLDLSNGPLFKVYLHRLTAAQHLFTIIKHHVIADGWSSGIMMEDLSKMYNAYINGAKIILPKAAQLSDYAVAQEKFKSTAEYKETENYWLNLYKDQIPVVDLPTDFPRTSPRSYKGKRIDHPISKELLDQLKSRGAKVGGSLVTTLLAAFEVFLYSKTKQMNLVVGLPASGQAASGLFDVVGHCVNLLPLKTIVNRDLSFSAYLKKRKNEVLDAYDHQRLTFGELIKKLYIQRDSSRITLVPVIFNIDMGMDQQVRFEGLDHKLISNPRAYETFDLYLNATGSKNGAILEWSFNTSLFKPETIIQYHQDFHELLEKIILNPELTISELTNIKSPVVAKGTMPVEQQIIQLFDEAVKNYPTKTAVCYQSEKISYRALATMSDQIALVLMDHGIKTGDVVALSIVRSIDMLATMLGILKAGGAYLPLDPEYPKERIEFMLEDSGASLLLVSERYKNNYQSKATEIVIEDIVATFSDAEMRKPGRTIKPADLAYVLYTSGSTGKPKGVKITHQNLANFLLSMQQCPGILNNDRLLAITTISFDIAGLELYLPLIAGAEIIIADAEAVKDGRILVDILNTQHISMMQATPSTWQMMIDAGWQGNSQLKILVGGEALSMELAKQLLQRSGSLWNMYGPTETTIWSAVKQILPGDPVISIGHPILNTTLYIMDEQGNRLPAGQAGEIWIGGDGVSAGYLNRPDLTADKFVDDVYAESDGAKLYKTGDLGKVLDNGEFLCMGRIDQQVKIRGHRIELGEIESLLSSQEGIKQSVVVALEDQPGDKRLVAYVTLDEMVEEDTLSWKDRWETLYNIGAETNDKQADANQDLDGTLLNYYENGADLALQSAEWLQSSIHRIKKLGSRRIYEIGSGAGQILYELAPGIDYYVATDYAQTAIDKLNEKLQADPERWGHVKAKVASADDFTQVKDDTFDLVLIHSVAQYFPGADYLIQVVKEAIVAIGGNGHVFIGDMQGKNSLEMCHAMDHLPNAPDENPLSLFKEIIQNRTRIEDEFIADPNFFYTLSSVVPEISAVEIQLRKGKSLNETTKYHYDVCLYVGKKPSIVRPEKTIRWSDSLVLPDVEKLLYEYPKRVIEVKGILNKRTAKDYRLLQLMQTANPEMLSRDVKADLEKAPLGQHPDLFWEMAEKFNFNAHIRWTTDGADGLFDVVFIPASLHPALPYVPFEEPSALNIHEYSRTPFSKKELKIASDLSEKWKAGLAEKLPSFMVPDEFVGLKKFPLTPNAKIDRKALPKPAAVSRQRSKSAEGASPRTAHEQLVAKIWTEVLGIEDLKVTDDFFRLGGHSLLAMKVMIAIEKETGKRLPLAIFFDNSTIEKMALQLRDDKPATVWNAIVPIKPTGSKPPLFLIHGGGLNVLLFKSISKYFHDDQPIYGIQALGLNKETIVPDNMVQIAAEYIREILLVDPIGPYSLAGYSLGGFFAFEIAKQLKNMGKAVKLVGVIDTYASTGERLSSSDRIMKKIKRQFNKVPFFLNSFQKYPQETLAYQAKILRYKINKLASENATIEERVLTDYELAIYEKYSTALRNYILAPFDLRVTLLRAQKRLYYLDDQKYLGWSDYALQGVEIHEVPGDHKTFLYPPNDKIFVDVIQSVLNSRD